MVMYIVYTYLRGNNDEYEEIWSLLDQNSGLIVFIGSFNVCENEQREILVYQYSHLTSHDVLYLC